MNLISASKFDFDFYINHLRDNVMPLIEESYYEVLEKFINVLKDCNTTIKCKVEDEVEPKTYTTTPMTVKNNDKRGCEFEFKFKSPFKIFGMNAWLLNDDKHEYNFAIYDLTIMIDIVVTEKIIQGVKVGSHQIIIDKATGEKKISKYD
jgi:hypothetical protein